MATIAVAKVEALLKLEDGTEFLINEGDVVTDLVYKQGKLEKTLSGSCRVIIASTKANTAGPTTCPPDPYLHNFITVARLVIDSSDIYGAVLNTVDVANIVSIGSVSDPDDELPENTVVVGPGPEYKDLADVVAEVEDGATVMLLDGEYTSPLNLGSKNITLMGAGEVTLTGAITLDFSALKSEPVVTGDSVTTTTAEVAVTLDSLNLTGDALVTVNTIAGVNPHFTMINCTFGGHNMEKKTMAIAVKNEFPILLTIENNTFGAQNANSYNLIDVYGKLMDGSSISNNVFEVDCCGHNKISLYGVEDNATIHIDNNFCGNHKAMVRYGFKGSPRCTVTMDCNEWDDVDLFEGWPGLFLIQPYGKATETFAGMTLKFYIPEVPEDLLNLGYIWASANDMQWTDDNRPTYYVNDVITEIPLLVP